MKNSAEGKDGVECGGGEYGNMDPKLASVLDELCFRFLHNLPESEYESFERLFFAVEAAHWFYDDFSWKSDKSLPRLNLKAFSLLIFAHSPILRPYVKNVSELANKFQAYKREVPVCGAALLNPDMKKVVLVCGWGKHGRWGFPKGKIAKDETELEAAVREVREETGYDFSHLVQDDVEPSSMDTMRSGRLSRIFVVSGVPENTQFQTQTRKEISRVEWVPLHMLPQPRKGQPAVHTGQGPTGVVNEQFHGREFSKSFLGGNYSTKLNALVKRLRKANESACEQQNVKGHSTLSTEITGNIRGSSADNDSREAGSASTQKKSAKKNDAGLSRAPYHTVTAEERRDAKTFGSNSSSKRMTDRERDEFFAIYVRDADKRAAALGLGDDHWPVPYITSKDLDHSAGAGMQQPQVCVSDRHPVSAVFNVDETKSSSKWPQQQASVSRYYARNAPFAFNRDHILSCFQ